MISDSKWICLWQVREVCLAVELSAWEQGLHSAARVNVHEDVKLLWQVSARAKLTLQVVCITPAAYTHHDTMINHRRTP